MTDPTHPLFGRVLKLTALATLHGHRRFCQVEVLPDQCAYVPVASTSLSSEPRPEPSVLTARAIAELVAAFQAIPVARRSSHGNRPQSERLDPATGQRTRGRHRGNRRRPHGGGGE